MFGRQFDRYVCGALLPYIGLSLVILTAILLTQQAARFAEVLDGADTPLGLVYEVVQNLLPNILIFSIPMSVLTGTATGFSRLGSDSELVAMRAAGVGTWRIISPALLLGAAICAFNVYTGFVWAPAAARNLTGVALRAALHKLESPVDPRSFYTGMPGKVVYVRDGDREKGQWGRVFMHWSEPGGEVRLVTAAGGRLDTSGEQTELVLEDAVMTTLSQGDRDRGAGSVTTEHSARLRFRDDRLNLSRSQLIKKISEREPELEELSWSELRAKAAGSDKDSERAVSALHRRLSMCLAPLAFVLLGGSFGLKIGRGGRSVGVLASLVALVLYYLLALLGEQMWRAGLVSPIFGAWLAFGVSLLVGGVIIASYRRHFTFPQRFYGRGAAEGAGKMSGPGRPRRLILLGLLDRSIITSLLKNLLLVLSALIAIFFIFTLFELLRFIAAGGSTAQLVLRYLFFLLPYVCVAVTPVSMLLAVLITYALLARRSEAISWWASGQSVYRLLVPCFLCALAVGGALWGVQEKLMPSANRRQNALRVQIRSGGVQSEPQTGRVWVASGDTRRIYSYAPGRGAGGFVSPLVFDFDEGAVHLLRIVSGERASIPDGRHLEVEGAKVLDLSGGQQYLKGGTESLEVSDPEVFKYQLNNPHELDAGELSAYIKTLKRNDGDVQSLSVALERKRAEPFSPIVMALVGAPLALAFGRRSAVTALCAAVFIALTFLGVTSGLQQIGLGGLLPPFVAAWSPIFIFAAVGLYFLTRAKT
jgi:LPS export ABC transporter permease LptG/LPS export ABC transporter permease LptF